jgi:Fic family protein
MAKRKTGSFEITAIAGENVSSFVPFPLPPEEPLLELEGKLEERLRKAREALARLDLAGEMIPSLDWFLYAFVRKEAVLSSQIEGTQTTLTDLLAYEAGQDTESDAPPEDLEEVCNYLEALTFAREQLSAPDGLPLSMRLLNETHQILLKGVRGATKLPGEIRRSQNWIGGSRPGNASFVPPPPHRLGEVLSDLEKYIHAEDELSPLLRAGLIHVQFETIHPYLDGNGRIGRLLVTLLLEHWQQLGRPLLYLSLFFKRHRNEYFRRLAAVRHEGDWEGWLDFFLDGVATISEEAVGTAKDLFSLVSEDRERVLDSSHSSLVAMRIFEILPRYPIVSISFLTRKLGTTKPTTGKAVRALADLGVLVETTGKKRDRSWVYEKYLERLRVEEMPLKA